MGLAAVGCTGGKATPPVSPSPRSYSIVPAPQRIQPRAGAFRLSPATRITLSDPADAELRALADLLLVPLRAASGLPLPVSTRPGDEQATDVISLRLTSGSASSHPESYRLVVTSERAALSAGTTAGLFWGLQTIRQLLPPELEGGRPGPQPGWTIPALEVDDEPRFPYRAVLLDVARWFYPPEFIKKLIDLLALYKMNTLQLHLTDDQGWRLEIKQYPRLTGVGAWRKETMLAKNFEPYVGDGRPHGGFYTQEQIRDLVAYAAARHVTIVPEIEMPGHAGAALAAYPELSCTGGPFEVSPVWGVHQDIFCPSERTFGFLEHVLLEVMQLFPSTYIHIGGDEVPKDQWKQSPVAQEVIRREGLAGEEELQSYFVGRIQRFLSVHGRRMIGWDEILEGGIPPEATVMSWRGDAGGIAAARQGHDVIMAPNNRTYFDYYQGDPAPEPLAIGGFVPLDSVYAFEIVPEELTTAESAHVIGAEGCLWTEYIPNPALAEYMLLPRMLALSEALWSPTQARRWGSFAARLPAQFARLDALGAEYRVPEPVGLGWDRLVLEDRVQVTLGSPVPGGVVRYTTDASVPSASSAEYTGPIDLRVSSGPRVVSAKVFLPSGRASPVARVRIARAVWHNPLAVRRDTLQAGLDYEYAEGSFQSAEDIRGVEPGRVGSVPGVGLRGDERPEDYGVRLSGFICVPQDALYSFSLGSDDGSRLRVAGELVFDRDGPQRDNERPGQIALRAGCHPMEVVYFQASGGAALKLEVSTPASTKVPVPENWYAH